MAKKSALSGGNRIETIHYGIDTSVYNSSLRQEARKALGIPADDEVICFAAHDVRAPHKGGIQLAEALAAITRRKPIHLLTMGSGHFRVPEQFHHRHFGKIESDELQAVIYRAADVFVIPSLEEAFGQTALEAVACGTVVAGFEVGGVVDIVKNDLNGKLVPKGDSSALADAITQLMGDLPLRQLWRDMALDWVGDHFSYHRNASAYASLYEELIMASKK
jgi:glycosyltransferase involved in cell wall biosynthesis